MKAEKDEINRILFDCNIKMIFAILANDSMSRKLT